ncbi:MAG: hypothetical protein FWD32_01980 [Firmicutes bacterium]|nr:hypothetical protein [Bacillota bacterium]
MTKILSPNTNIKKEQKAAKEFLQGASFSQRENFKLTEKQKKEIEQKADELIEALGFEKAHLEIGRFQDELYYLDTHFFIPVDFENQDEIQKHYIGHNIFVGFQLHKKIRPAQEANIFKYISNQQIVDIFVNNKMKKEDIPFKEIEQEPKGKFIHYSQLSKIAKDFKELREQTINNCKHEFKKNGL